MTRKPETDNIEFPNTDYWERDSISLAAKVEI